MRYFYLLFLFSFLQCCVTQKVFASIEQQTSHHQDYDTKVNQQKIDLLTITNNIKTLSEESKELFKKEDNPLEQSLQSVQFVQKLVDHYSVKKTHTVSSDVFKFLENQNKEVQRLILIKKNDPEMFRIFQSSMEEFKKNAVSFNTRIDTFIHNENKTNNKGVSILKKNKPSINSLDPKSPIAKKSKKKIRIAGKEVRTFTIPDDHRLRPTKKRIKK